VSLHQARITTAAFFGLLLIASGISQNVKADPAPTTTTTTTVTTKEVKTVPARSRKDSNRQLQAALRHLRAAKAELQNAAPIYHGERAEALKSTDKAIAEVQEALKIK
jgi:Cu/Ag efflux pump CusA